MSEDLTVQNGISKDESYFSMGTDGTCVDGLVQGHMTMTDGVEWGGQTLADKCRPHRKNTTLTDVARLPWSVTGSAMLPFQCMSRWFNQRGVIPTSHHRDDHQEFFNRDIYYRLSPAKKDQTGLWPSIISQRPSYSPAFPMQEIVRQIKESGNGDWLAKCCPRLLQKNTLHCLEDVTGLNTRHINDLQTNPGPIERITVNVEKWKEYFWQMYDIPNPMATWTSHVDFNMTKAISLGTENGLGKPCIKASTYGIEPAHTINRVRLLKNSIKIYETDDKLERDLCVEQVTSGGKQRLCWKKRIVRASRKLFCCVLKD